MYSYGPQHMAVQKQDDQHEHTFSSYVRIRDVVLKTCLRRWTIGRSGEIGSGISVLPARHDDDDDDDDDESKIELKRKLNFTKYLNSNVYDLNHFIFFFAFMRAARSNPQNGDCLLVVFTECQPLCYFIQNRSFCHNLYGIM